MSVISTSRVVLMIVSTPCGVECLLLRRLLVGAPLGQNLQPGTNRSGALWKCPLTTWTDDCEQVITDGKRNAVDGFYDSCKSSNISWAECAVIRFAVAFTDHIACDTNTNTLPFQFSYCFLYDLAERF
ncbi:integrin [Homalodisca vitripennis]|nr:integrin [Homalodisca vitripennis]